MNGDLFTFAGRTVKFASILEFNKQRFADIRSQEVLDGDVVALGGYERPGRSQVLGIRHRRFEVPVFENFIVNLAGRFDNYDDASDVGGASARVLAMEYRPSRRCCYAARRVSPSARRTCSACSVATRTRSRM